jgi:hypothetical protein
MIFAACTTAFLLGLNIAVHQPAAPQPTHQRAPLMTPEQLTAEIQSGTSDAVATATKMGPAALPTLQKLANDPDPDVRLMVITCFDAVGGDAAVKAGVDALLDTDPQVASRATVLLHNHPPKGYAAQLQGAFGASKETYVRTEIPKIVGRIGGEPEIKVWTTILPTVKEHEVRDGVMMGLARMGHQPSRDWFKTQLAAADGPPAREWLEAAEYMADAWVVPTLAQLLNRRTTVYTASADFQPINVRVCDLSAYLILKLTKAKVEFPVTQRRYNDVELDEARKAAAAVK